MRRKHGGCIDAAVSLTPRIEPVDEYTGFSAIVTDLRSRRELEKAQQMARHLDIVNQLAHEINNPLQAIANCLALLSAANTGEYAQIALGNVTRIADVITRLLEVTRI